MTDARPFDEAEFDTKAAAAIEGTLRLYEFAGGVMARIQNEWSSEDARAYREWERSSVKSDGGRLLSIPRWEFVFTEGLAETEAVVGNGGGVVADLRNKLDMNPSTLLTYALLTCWSERWKAAERPNAARGPAVLLGKAELIFKPWGATTKFQPYLGLFADALSTAYWLGDDLMKVPELDSRIDAASDSWEQPVVYRLSELHGDRELKDLLKTATAKLV